MKTGYYYKACPGLYKRNQILQWFVLGALAFIFGASFLGDVGLAAGIAIAIGGFLYIMTQYSSERNVLLFTEKGLEHFRTERSNAKLYKYEDVISFHTNDPHRGEHFMSIAFAGGTTFYFNEIERTGGLDVNFNNLYRFLWSHNEAITITKTDKFEHYKYFLHHNDVRKVPV